MKQPWHKGNDHEADDERSWVLRPRFQRWLRAALLHEMGVVPDRPARLPLIPHDVRHALVDWLCEQPNIYVRWIPAEAFHGKGYSSGSYSVKWESVARDIPEGIAFLEADAAKRRDAETVSSLEDWLKADIEGRLTYAGDAGGASELPAEVRRSLSVAARSRSRRHPRTCVACGSSFPPVRENARRCPVCVSLSKRPAPVLPSPSGGNTPQQRRKNVG